MKQTGIGCVSISSQSCTLCVCCWFLNYKSKNFNYEREGFKVGGEEGMKTGDFLHLLKMCEMV